MPSEVTTDGKAGIGDDGTCVPDAALAQALGTERSHAEDTRGSESALGGLERLRG
jgi:hypothetical protein